MSPTSYLAALSRDIKWLNKVIKLLSGRIIVKKDQIVKPFYIKF